MPCVSLAADFKYQQPHVASFSSNKSSTREEKRSARGALYQPLSTIHNIRNVGVVAHIDAGYRKTDFESLYQHALLLDLICLSY